MKKIALIFTGGTIGSSINAEGFISTDEKSADVLLGAYRNTRTDAPEFTVYKPFRLLSENLNAEYSNALVAAVDEAIAANPDGIIITHGTDTLQYSATMLSYALGSKSLPVVLVSSNYPLGDPRANGLKNFSAAVAFIEGGAGKGVFAAYSNGAEVIFHRGSRLLAHAAFTDALFSANNAYYGTYANGKFTKNPSYTAREEDKTLRARLSQKNTVLWLTAHPDMLYPEPTEGVKAVLISTYHSGTVCTDTKFLEFCAKMRAHKIPVFLTGVSEGIAYESTKAFAEAGITPAVGLAPIAAYLKLRLIFEANADLSLMSQSIGEDL